MSSDRIELAKESEFDGDGSRIIVSVRGKEIAIFRHEGEYHAVLNFCVHQSGPLCEGGMTGKSVVGEDGWDWQFEDEKKYISCPWHGWTFDITTGKNINDEKYSVPTYGLEVEDETIYLMP